MKERTTNAFVDHHSARTSAPSHDAHGGGGVQAAVPTRVLPQVPRGGDAPGRPPARARARRLRRERRRDVRGRQRAGVARYVLRGGALIHLPSAHDILGTVLIMSRRPRRSRARRPNSRGLARPSSTTEISTTAISTDPRRKSTGRSASATPPPPSTTTTYPPNLRRSCDGLGAARQSRRPR